MLTFAIRDLLLNIFLLHLALVYSKFLRSCRNNSLNIHESKMEMSYTEQVVGEIDSIKLNLHINWTIGGVRDSEYDGFLVKLEDNTGMATLPKADVCLASSTHLWVTTSNASCDVFNGTESECRAVRHSPTEVVCECDRSACSLFSGLRCSGTASKLKYKQPYHSLPKSARSMQYDIDFNANYKFLAFPYYRQWDAHSYDFFPIPPNCKCAETIAMKYTISLDDAVRRCCESNISTIAPLKLTIGEPIPDYSTSTLNMTVSWILYGRHKQLRSINAFVTSTEHMDYTPRVTNYVPPLPAPGNDSCPTQSTIHTATVYNLLPNNEYQLLIIPCYVDVTRGRCTHAWCKIKATFRTKFIMRDQKFNTSSTETTELTTTESARIDGTIKIPTRDVISCASNFKYCVEMAQCIETNVNGSQRATCRCRSGSFGDGKRELYNGTGCFRCPVRNMCDEYADCIASDATSYECQCDSYHYGDGFKSGTGCSSRAKWIATIVVPVIIIVVILLAAICWSLCQRPTRAKHSAVCEEDPL